MRSAGGTPATRRNVSAALPVKPGAGGRLRQIQRSLAITVADTFLGPPTLAVLLGYDRNLSV